eukprot:Gb_03194 [translate_table: standard]
MDLPKGKLAIGCRLVFKTKLRLDGIVDRYKAKLVAKGYAQQYGIDYEETFAQCQRLSICMVLALAVQHGWDIHQLDVKSTFFNDTLVKEVYMEQPPGFAKKGTEHLVCRLKKALGSQALRAWYSRIHDYCMHHGFVRSPSETNLYVKINDSQFTIVALYVDDMIVIGNNEQEIDSLKADMKKTFEMSDMGLLHYFLGVESTIDFTLYMELIGSLIYLTITWLDISFAIGLRSRFIFMFDPQQSHLKSAKRILRYLKGMTDFVLEFTQNSYFKLTGHSDFDWAGCVDSWKSTGGYCFNLGLAVIFWCSRKQFAVALFFIEAKYRVVVKVACETTWLRRLLADVGVDWEGPTTIFCNNQSVLKIVRNLVFHERTKYFEVHLHFIRE